MLISAENHELTPLCYVWWWYILERWWRSNACSSRAAREARRQPRSPCYYFINNIFDYGVISIQRRDVILKGGQSTHFLNECFIHSGNFFATKPAFLNIPGLQSVSLKLRLSAALDKVRGLCSSEQLPECINHYITTSRLSCVLAQRPKSSRKGTSSSSFSPSTETA